MQIESVKNLLQVLHCDLSHQLCFQENSLDANPWEYYVDNKYLEQAKDELKCDLSNDESYYRFCDDNDLIDIEVDKPFFEKEAIVNLISEL